MKNRIIIILLFVISMVFFTTPVLALRDYGLTKSAETAGLTKAGSNLPVIIGNVVGSALSLVAVAFFALMLYGGFMWMTAKGNEQNSTKALDTIFAAIIGLIIILASYALTNFVFDSLFGKTSGTSSIPKQGIVVLVDDLEQICSINSSAENCRNKPVGAPCTDSATGAGKCDAGSENNCLCIVNTPLTTTPPASPTCGNNTTETGEECDDGNTNDGDGCSSTCQTETPTPSPVCGNGITETYEECDDGNTDANDSCDEYCFRQIPKPTSSLNCSQYQKNNCLPGTGCTWIEEMVGVANTVVYEACVDKQVKDYCWDKYSIDTQACDQLFNEGRISSDQKDRCYDIRNEKYKSCLST